MGRIGESVARLEDFPLLTGRGRFAADIGFPGQVHMRVARSPVAAGRIVAIDTGAARDAPGVLAVWTGADVADLPPIAFRMTWVPGLDRYRQPILAQGRVRYVGEPIAAVFADDPYRAEDAAELVFADIEELPAQLRAIDPPGEFDDGVSTDPATVAKGYGDLDAAFAAAAHVLELELAVGRHTGMPLETRGAIARFDPGLDRLELHGAAKVPHANRNFIAEMLGLSPGRMHLFEGHVGGGFGIRGELYPEDVLVCLAALRLGRPVKWIEDRREHLLAANHSRDQVHRIRLAVDRSGFVLGVDDEFWVDQGAYIRTHAATVTDLAAAMLPGPYRFPAYRSRGHIRLTNKTPAGTYRAPGRYETTFVRERAMDAVAALLGADPVTIRRINFIGAGEMPFDRGIEALGTPVVYDSADFEGLLDKLLAHVDYDALQRKCAMRRGRGEHVGIGIACFVEKSGLGPFDEVHLSVDAGGDVEAVTGVASLGQGVETVIAQIVADALGVDYRKVRVVHGQTDRIGRGMGAFASRVTVMTGSAATLAARDLRRRICEKAAELLQHPVGSLSIDGGRIAVSGMPGGPSIPIGDVVRAIAPDGGRLRAEATFETGHMTYPYGIHLAVARVDGETSAVHLERFVVAYDIGRCINPMLVEGQLAGGVAQGIGGALFEEFVYDERAQPLTTSFADYLMPTLDTVPEVDVLLTEDAPSPINPLGVKGAGEGGTTAAGAAIAAAVDAALGTGFLIRRLPVSPGRLRDVVRSGMPLASTRDATTPTGV